MLNNMKEKHIQRREERSRQEDKRRLERFVLDVISTPMYPERVDLCTCFVSCMAVRGGNHNTGEHWGLGRIWLQHRRFSHFKDKCDGGDGACGVKSSH